MSSILDALNKLELDRAADGHLPGRNRIEPEFAGREPLERRASRGRITLRVSLFSMILAGSVFTLVLVSVSVGASVMIMRGSDSSIAVMAASGGEDVGAALSSTRPSPESMALIEAEATPPEPVTAAVSEEDASLVVSASPIEEAPRATQGGSAQGLEVAPVVGAEPVSREPAAEAEKIVVAEASALPGSSVVREGPISDIVAKERPAAVAQIEVPEVPGRSSGRWSVAARIEEAPAVQSMTEYPMLTRADSERYADGQLRINMLGPASEKNPYGFAVINRIKIYEGQNIPGTRLELVGVVYGGVGVKVRDSNLRYFIPF